MATVTIGNKPATRDSGYTTVATNDLMRLCVFNKTTKPLWLFELSAILGRASANPVDYRLVVYQCSDGKVPRLRLGYVNIRTVNTAMTDKDGGTVVTYQLSVSDTGPSSYRGALIPANKYFALGYEVDAGAPLGHGYKPAASLPNADNVYFYDITGVTTPPVDYPDNYDHYTRGWLSVWARADENIAPEVPVGRTPSGLIATVTPTFASDFRDKNGVYGGEARNRGDLVQRVEIELRDDTTSAIIWNPTYTASVNEQNDNRTSRAYTGPALVKGRSYSWRIHHQDFADEWGLFSGWLTFEVPLDLYVTLTAPVGSLTAPLTTQTPTISGRWNSATLAANAVRVYVKVGAATISDSGIKATSIAAGATFNLSWTSLLALPPLDWGATYTLAVQARDTTNVWSQLATITVTTNTAPTIPSKLSPSGSTYVTTPPVLKADASDANTAKSALTVKARLYDAATDALISTLTLPYNATSGLFEVASGITIKKPYYWRAYSFDGSLWSGEAILEADAAVSGAAAFEYKDGPVLAITAPVNGSQITASNTPLAWTCPTQARFEVQLYVNGTAATGVIAVIGTATTWTPPSGLATTGDTVSYHLRVYDGAGLSDYEETTVTLVYPPPAAVTNLTATPYTVGGEPQATAIWLFWDQTTDPNARAYLVYRDDLAAPIARIENLSSTLWIDYAAVSGVSHSYTVQVVIRNPDGSENAGLPASASAFVLFDGIVLYYEGDPEGLRFTARAWDERGGEQQGNEVTLKPWTTNAPITVRDPGVWLTGHLTIPLWNDDAGTGAAKRDVLLALGRQAGPHIFKSSYALARRVSIPLPDGVSFDDGRGGLIRATVLLRDEATL
jgi:hypothetical protein